VGRFVGRCLHQKMTSNVINRNSLVLAWWSVIAILWIVIGWLLRLNALLWGLLRYRSSCWRIVLCIGIVLCRVLGVSLLRSIYIAIVRRRHNSWLIRRRVNIGIVRWLRCCHYRMVVGLLILRLLGNYLHWQGCWLLLVVVPGVRIVWSLFVCIIIWLVYRCSWYTRRVRKLFKITLLLAVVVHIVF
jgi:hypothetical protein